jgi:hypothetical protein
MSKKKKRDNSYYERWLKANHPSIYADLKAGKIANVRQARLKAGNIKPPSPLRTLKQTWAKASSTEQREFLEWVPKGAIGSTGSPPEPIADHERRLTAKGKARIRAVMSSLRMTVGDVSAQIGFSKLDGSLGNALGRRSMRLNRNYVVRLENWLAKIERSSTAER